MHALIIEDHVIIARMIEEELRDAGYTSFDIVSREAEALRAAEKRCPDLITADQSITEGDGIRAVLTICETRAIPVVFAAGSPTEIRRLVPGAIVVPKPFGGTELRNAVDRAVEKATGRLRR